MWVLIRCTSKNLPFVAKNRFSGWLPWRPSCIFNGTILAIFIFTSAWCFLPSFKSVGLLVQKKKRKIDFQDGRHGSHLGFPTGTILIIFDQQVTPALPTKFKVNCPLGSGEKAKNRFSRWMPWRPSWISDRNDFIYFWSTSHPDASYQVSIGLSVQEKRRKIDFQNSRYGDHFGFLIGTILSTFDLQVTPMLPTKFQVNWLFGSEEEAKNRFSRWTPKRSSWISDRNDFSHFSVYQQFIRMLPTELQNNWLFSSGKEAKNKFSRWLPCAIFDLQVTPMLPTKLQVGSGEEAKNRFLRWLPQRPSWISDPNDFSYFWSTSHSDAFYQVSSQLAFCSGEEAKNRFSRWPLWSHPEFPIRKILDIFDLQATRCFLPSYKSIGPSVQEKKR